MADYDELARFRSKSGNLDFRLRSVEQPATEEPGHWRLLDEVTARRRAASSDVRAVHDEPAWAAAPAAAETAAPRPVEIQAGSAFSLGFVDDDVAAQQRRAQLAGLFRRPEPTPGPAPGAAAPTPLRPLLRRIAARHG